MLEVTRLIQTLSQERSSARVRAQENSTEIVVSFLRAKRPKSALTVALFHSPVALRLSSGMIGLLAVLMAWSRLH